METSLDDILNNFSFNKISIDTDPFLNDDESSDDNYSSSDESDNKTQNKSEDENKTFNKNVNKTFNKNVNKTQNKSDDENKNLKKNVNKSDDDESDDEEENEEEESEEEESESDNKNVNKSEKETKNINKSGIFHFYGFTIKDSIYETFIKKLIKFYGNKFKKDNIETILKSKEKSEENELLFYYNEKIKSIIFYETDIYNSPTLFSPDELVTLEDKINEIIEKKEENLIDFLCDFAENGCVGWNLAFYR